jgi:iron complex transport system substrate-binding protein
MRHLVGLLTLTCAGALLAAGCGQAPAATGPIHLTDDMGRQLTLKAPVTRIVSLGPSNTQILLALGLRKDIVGIDDESIQYDPEPYSREAKGLTVVGDSYTGLNVEKIAALHPQLVLAMQGVKNISEVEALHLKVATLDPGSVQGIYKDIAFVGRATGRSGKAAALVASMKSRLQAIAKAVRKLSQPKVFVELDPTQYYTAGPGSFLDGLIKMAGGANIADKVTTQQYPALSSETIIAQDPQVIVLLDTPSASAKTVAARPGWSEISAVRHGRVVQNIDPNLLADPAPALVQGVKELAQDLHPGHRIP